MGLNRAGAGTTGKTKSPEGLFVESQFEISVSYFHSIYSTPIFALRQERCTDFRQEIRDRP